MSRVCQVPCGVFAISLAISLGASVVEAVEPAPHAAPVGIPVHLTAWAVRPFAETVLADPDLASCFLISPRWWNTSAAPASLPGEPALSKALAAQLHGLVDPAAVPGLDVVVAAAERTSVSAVAHGDSVLVLVPKSQPSGGPDIARAVAQALLVAGMQPAEPDTRCGEPLAMLAEGIAASGSLYLAALPPELRPVKDWLEPKDAGASLATLAEDALDPDARWASRRARLARMSQVDGTSPSLAAATALVVEAYGDAVRARRHPFDLLLAWQKGSGAEYPKIPRDLRKALDNPLEAGLPKTKDTSDRAEVERDAFARRLAAGDVPLAEIPPPAAPATRLLAAAQLRARGGPGLCEWLKGGALPQVRTGCRSEGEEGGVVFARPTASGSQIVAFTPAGDEGVLLVWPRWTLFPIVVPSTGELWFVDAKGVWHVPLDGHAAPRLAATGSFRHLAASADGSAAATTRWPSGEALLLADSGVKQLPVNGRGGIAWLETDVLVASDGKGLTLVSTQGKTQPDVALLPCCHALVASRGGLVGAVSPPCDPGLVRLGLADRSVKIILKLGDGPVGLVQLSGGALAFGGPEGVSRWDGEGQPERVADGLTPGPG